VARRLTAAMVRDYDLILAMELEHIEQVTAIAPSAAK
jgi:protein-tyrosine phosphatase